MNLNNLKTKLVMGLAIGGFLIAGVACTHPTENLDTIPTVCFEGDVLPIFQTNCALSGCHSGSHPEEGYSCTDYASIMKKITPNSLSDSKAYKAITDTWFNTMPPSPHAMLSLEQRTLIALWIQQGAKDTKCGK